MDAVEQYVLDISPPPTRVLSVTSNDLRYASEAETSGYRDSQGEHIGRNLGRYTEYNKES